MASLSSDIRPSMVARLAYSPGVSTARLTRSSADRVGWARRGRAPAGMHVAPDELELGRVPHVADREDRVLRARVGPVAQPVDERGRASASRSGPSGVIETDVRLVRSIDAVVAARPSRNGGGAPSNLWRSLLGRAEHVARVGVARDQAQRRRARRRRRRGSGGCGRLSACGLFRTCVRVRSPALERVLGAALAAPAGRARSGACPRAARSGRARAGIGMPRPRDSSSFQAAPMPNQARPPDSTSSVVIALSHRPGWR